MKYCAANPTEILQTPDDCAQYYNCSKRVTGLDDHVMECNYPDLFSNDRLICETFTNVSCDDRNEPQAPCKHR